MKTTVPLYLNLSQLCHILTSKLARTPETPHVSRKGVRMSRAGSSRKRIHQWKKHTMAYDPKLWGTQRSSLKYWGNIWCVHVLGVCLYTEKEEAAVSMWKPWKAFYCAPLCGRTHLFTSLKCLCVALATFPIISPFLCQSHSLSQVT